MRQTKQKLTALLLAVCLLLALMAPTAAVQMAPDAAAVEETAQPDVTPAEEPQEPLPVAEEEEPPAPQEPAVPEEPPVSEEESPVPEEEPAVPEEPSAPEDTEPGQTDAVDTYAAGTAVTAARRDGFDVASIHYKAGSGTEQRLSFQETGDGYVYTLPYGVTEEQVTVEYFSTTSWDGAVDISWYDDGQTSFTLTTPAQLAGLAALVNGRTSAETSLWRVKGDTALLVSTRKENVELVGAGGGNVCGTVYYSSAKYDFADKTVYLGSDMDMGGQANWTPIGGKYVMDVDAQDDPILIEAFFNGTLDGRGHRITNLYCDRYCSKHFSYSQAIGLVGYLGELYAGEAVPARAPTVRNLSVSGSIHGRRMVGGIVGRVGGIETGVRIENCANYAAVSSTDAKGVGGIVGAGWGKGYIVNCYNTGAVSSTYTCPAGGICGNNQGLHIYACYNVGQIFGSDGRGRGIGGHDSGVYTVANCYTLENCDNDPASGGWYTGSTTACTVQVGVWTDAKMRSAALVEALNANGGAYAYRSGGYPQLFWEQGWPDGTCEVTVQSGAAVTVSADPCGSVARGTVAYLSHTVTAGSVFRYYTANGEKLLGDYYTAAADVTLGAVTEAMLPGTLQIPESSVYTLTMKKTGTITRADGTSERVTNYPVHSGDTIYEGDVLTATATLRTGVVPGDTDYVYSGKFTYTFRYDDGSDAGKSNSSGQFTATGNTAPLVVTATAQTARKLWTQTADTSWYNAGKTTFTLTTPRQLAGLALLVNNGTDDFSGKTITLGNDIVLRNDDGTHGTRLWDGIGRSNSFRGTFDGGQHTISQMTASAGGNSSGNAALFLNCDGAVIRDLTVEGTVTGGRAAGLVLDMKNTTVQNCIVAVAVTATGTNGSGGIVGTAGGSSVISRCQNRYSVTGRDGVGGLVGKLEGGTVQDSVNYGMVTGSGENYGLGGLAGSVTSGTLQRCANYGVVSGTNWYTGGLAGVLGSGGTAVVQNCYNTASVTGGHSTYARASVGGLAGRAVVYSLKNCFNCGQVSVDGDRKGTAGGVFGADGANSKSSRTSVWYLNSTCAAAVGGSTTALSGIASCTATELSGTKVLNAINSDQCFAMAGQAYPELTGLQRSYAIQGRISAARGTVATVRLTQGDRLVAETQTTDAFIFFVTSDSGYALTFSAADCVSRRVAVAAGKAGDVGGVALCRPGDVDLNGVLDVYDLQRLYEHLTGARRLTDSYALQLADVTGDGAVDTRDTQRLHQQCMGANAG